MSASSTPVRDLILPARLPAATAMFTTFARGHFVKPGEFFQPVRATAKAIAGPASFSGCYREVFVAAPIELGCDQRNRVSESELELIQPGTPPHEVRRPASVGSSRSAA